MIARTKASSSLSLRKGTGRRHSFFWRTEVIHRALERIALLALGAYIYAVVDLHTTPPPSSRVETFENTLATESRVAAKSNQSDTPNVPIENKSERSLIGGKSRDAFPDCSNVKLPKRMKRPLPECVPTYLSCYPGSGSEMTRKLIETFTGMPTLGIYAPNKPPRKPYNYVAFKTHAPMGAEPYPGVFPTVLILLRSPLDAIPSYGNWIWESKHYRRHHTTQASESDWIKWRDKAFAANLDQWKDVLEYWLNHYGPNQRLILQYERLTDEETGPAKATELSRFLGNKSSVIESHIPCIWRSVVKEDGGARLRDKSYIPMYTTSQLDNVTTYLDDLYQKYEDDETLRVAIADYQKMVSHRRQLVTP